jgi:hypothetical protein
LPQAFPTPPAKGDAPIEAIMGRCELQPMEETRPRLPSKSSGEQGTAISFIPARVAIG